MVTPFQADGSVNFASARRLAHHLIDTGSDGIVVCGTTGEGPTVSDREKLDLLEVITAEVGSTATVIANTGTYDTHHSVALTRAALESGVDGFLAVTPYYNKPPRAGIVAHFAAIAEAADGRPVIIYNIPQRVVVNLEPDLLAELDKIPNVVAVKQATPDLDQARRIMLETNLALYAGNDDLVYPFLQLGAIGGVCVASHVAGPAAAPDDRPGPFRRHGRRGRRERGAARPLRSPRGDDEPDPRQGGAQPARPRRGRPAPAARRCGRLTDRDCCRSARGGRHPARRQDLVRA